MKTAIAILYRLVWSVSLLGSTAWAVNEFRNASFEEAGTDVVLTGYNRYNSLHDPASIALATRPVELIRKDELADVLGAELGMTEQTILPWHLAEHADGGAFHGKRVLRCMKGGESLGFGLETEGGLYTFSLYARSKETDVVQLRFQDIRGRKGEIRFDQRKAFKVGDAWTRCVFTAKLTEGPVTCFVEMMGNGDLEVDAMQLEKGETATPFTLHPWDQSLSLERPDASEPVYPRTVQRVAVNYVAEPLKGIAPAPADAEDRPGSSGSLALHTWFPEGSPGQDLPATGGIPLPRGHVFSTRHLSVQDAQGKPVPAQFKALSRNVADGSIQMVLVDTQAALPPGSMLVYGSELLQPPFSSPLRIDETTDAVTIDTGCLRLVIQRSSGRLIDALWYDANQDGTYTTDEQVIDGSKAAGPFMQDQASRLYWGSLSTANQVIVEESGPHRGSVLFTGAHRSPEGHDLFNYEIRLHVFAGQPFLRLEHTFINAQRPYATIMNGAGLRLGFVDGWQRWTRWEAHPRLPLAPRSSLFLVEGVGSRHWVGDTVTSDDSPITAGWVTVGNDTSALTASIREWRDMPPKEFVVDAQNGLDLCIWPRHLTSGLAVPVGVARTHRLWLRWHTPNEPPAESTAWQAYFADQARVETTPDVYCDSSVFGHLAVQDAARFPAFETFLQRDELGHFPLPGEYSWSGDFINNGDDRGDAGFGNMETMLVHCMWLLYARSLDTWYYRRAWDAALHYRDVDVCHPWGQARVHTHNHTLRPWDFSHAWIKGTLEHYLLTGDTRSLQVAHEQGRWIRSIPVDYKVSTGSRRWTRCIQNLADLYRITGQRAYYDNFAARLEVADSLRGDNHDVSRFALHHIKKGESSHGRFDMQQYYGIAGLEEMHKATGEARWRDAFLDEMRFLLADRETHTEISNVDEAESWGRTEALRISSGRDRLIYSLLQHAYDLTHDERFRTAAIHAAFLETTRSDWKNGYPNLSWAGNVFAAYGVRLATDQGLGPAFENRLTGASAMEAGLPAGLRDPGFEHETPDCWASGKEILIARSLHHVQIQMDDQTVQDGQRSLTIIEEGLIAETKQLDRSKRLYPLTLRRALLNLSTPGTYELSGYIRFQGHSRPNVVLELDDLETGERRTLDLALPSLLPSPRYDDMLGLDGDLPQLGQPTSTEDQAKNLELDEPGRQGEKAAWYYFARPFALAHTSNVRVILQYHYGLRPPGRVWFDHFQLTPVPPTDSPDNTHLDLYKPPTPHLSP